ncbi:MAG: hypothetical protein JO256_13430 [Alphaproteobacteria bacterium]|nr:hypothetical protein [Alphaproteobacteria bacterium]
MSAIGMPGKAPIVMSACGYDHKSLFFERQQSLELRGMEWEGRIKPLTPWSALIARGAGALVLLGGAALMLIH